VKRLGSPLYKLTIFAYLVISIVAVPSLNALTLPVKGDEKIYTLKTTAGKNYSCMQSGATVAAGSLSKNKKKFVSLEPKYKKDIANLNKKAKDAKVAGKPKAALKFKRAVIAMKAEWASMTSACNMAFNCTVQTESKEFSIKENAEFEFDLSATTTCDAAPAYKITEQPAKGSLYGITASKFNYYAGFNTGSVSLKYQACVDVYSKCSEISEIKINISAGGDNVGRNDQLEPYRDVISKSEALHLLKKIALSDRYVLTDDLKSGSGYSLNAIVNKLIFDKEYTTPDLKGALDSMRDTVGWANSYKGIRDVDSNLIFQPSQTFETKEKQIAGLTKIIDNTDKYWLNWTYKWLFYGGTSTAEAKVHRDRYLNPLQALMSNIWYGHFGTSIETVGWDAEYYARDYVKLIEDNSLGNFKKMVIGENATSCLNGTGGGMICDGASNIWLSNQLNTGPYPNQNFGRELMELYLLGPIDPYTGKANYTEDDVAASTAYMSGYDHQWRSYLPSFTTLYPHSDPVEAYWRPHSKLVFNQGRHDFNDFTVFKGTPQEKKAAMTSPQWVEYLFDSHPALPRFIAGKLFRMLAYPDPSPELIQKLADRFKGSNYDISDLISVIASSEAMFSAKANEPKCIKEPFRIVMETFRNFNLPDLNNGMFLDSRPGQNWAYVQIYADVIYRIMFESGEKPLLYDTVFTHDYCGRSPQTFGQRWAFSVFLGKRIKKMILAMKASVDYSWGYFDFADLYKLIVAPGEDATAATPDKIINFFNSVYGIELSPEEYDVIKKYLVNTPVISGSAGNEIVTETPHGWSPTDRAYFAEKMSGLIVIYSAMSQSNVY
jgi:hypothetical protein